MKNNYNIPIGIVSVFWDYDEIEEKKDAFYELSVENKKNKFEFINNFYFLKDDTCISYEFTSTEKFKIILLEMSNNKIKIQICGDIIFLDKKQYKLLNEKITRLQEILKFQIDIQDKIKIIKQ